MIVTDRAEAMDLYREAQARGWVIPCFNSENLTTTEAILAAALEFGRARGIARVPVTIGITLQYPDRPQAVYYSHSRDWSTGLKLFLKDLEILAGPGGPYEDVAVMVHLDHVIHGLDEGIRTWDMGRFTSIMYDASALPFEENLKATAAFVERFGSQVLVEGACDEINAEGEASDELTSPDQAERYMRETGVDFIVANLGTEHRSSVSEVRYAGELAREIRDRIGPRLVLHGGTSVQKEAMAHLAEDGICKVNVWTLLERESGAELLEHLVRHAGRVAGEARIRGLKEKQLLGPAVRAEKVSLDYFSTTARQAVVFDRMKSIVQGFLSQWYRMEV